MVAPYMYDAIGDENVAAQNPTGSSSPDDYNFSCIGCTSKSLTGPVDVCVPGSQSSRVDNRTVNDLPSALLRSNPHDS
jgi:hypothetical protein